MTLLLVGSVIISFSKANSPKDERENIVKQVMAKEIWRV
jgi:hypothetical protein